MVIFTIPKAFTEPHINMIQHNAICSWLELPGDREVILCCDDPGVHEASERWRCSWFPDVARTPEGIPLVSDAFEQVQEARPNQPLLYVNADIILPAAILRAAGVVRSKFPDGYLLVGDRWDWHTPRDLTKDPWDEVELWKESFASGHRDPPVCCDQYNFPSGQYQGIMPDFAIGFYAWDSWLSAYTAFRMDLPVVDFSPVFQVIHQDHRHHRHSRVDPISLRNIGMLDDQLLKTSGRNDRMPYEIRPDWKVYKRES